MENTAYADEFCCCSLPLGNPSGLLFLIGAIYHRFISESSSPAATLVEDLLPLAPKPCFGLMASPVSESVSFGKGA